MTALLSEVINTTQCEFLLDPDRSSLHVGDHLSLKVINEVTYKDPAAV